MFDTLTKFDEKAENYRKIIEKERTDREQLDKKVMSVLHTVKQRYDSKLGMAKGKALDDKKSCPNDTFDWGTNDNDNNDTNEKNDNNENWESANNDAGWNDNNDGGWNDNNDNNGNNDNGWNQNADAGWNDNNNEKWNQDNNDFWTNSEEPKDDKKKSAKEENKCEGSGKKNKKNKGKDKDKDKDGQDEQNEQTRTGNNNQQQSQKPSGPADKKKDQSSNNKKDNDKRVEASGTNANTQKGNQNQTKETSATPTKDKGDKSGNNNKIDSSVMGSSDMKSKFLTAKLDLRLVEREQAILQANLDSIKAERDELFKKLATSRQQHEAAELKFRGATVDLLGANEALSKAHRKIDELEAEKRARHQEYCLGDSRRKQVEDRYASFQQKIAELEDEVDHLRDQNSNREQFINDLTHRNSRLQDELKHTKDLMKILKEGCSATEHQMETFEVRHNSIVMSKADLERELIAIKEETSRHITNIDRLQKANNQLTKAFVLSVEAHDECKNQIEVMQLEYSRQIESLKLENHKLIENNNQLRKLVEHMQRLR